MSWFGLPPPEKTMCFRVECGPHNTLDVYNQYTRTRRSYYRNYFPVPGNVFCLEEAEDDEVEFMQDSVLEDPILVSDLYDSDSFLQVLCGNMQFHTDMQERTDAYYEDMEPAWVLMEDVLEHISEIRDKYRIVGWRTKLFIKYLREMFPSTYSPFENWEMESMVYHAKQYRKRE